MSSTYWCRSANKKSTIVVIMITFAFLIPYVVLVYNQQSNNTNKRKKPILNEFAISPAILDKTKRESSKGK
jgi:hypothetical protein